MHNSNNARVIVGEVVARHDILAVCALHEKVPEPFCREAFREQAMKEVLHLAEVGRILSA